MDTTEEPALLPTLEDVKEGDIYGIEVVTSTTFTGTSTLTVACTPADFPFFRC